MKPQSQIEVNRLLDELKALDRKSEQASRWRKRFALTSTAMFLFSVVLFWIV